MEKLEPIGESGTLRESMNDDTLLFRNIHPSFIQAGQVTSQAFRPTPKDENKLSVYDGDRISPEKAWDHFTGDPRCTSAGILAVSKGECQKQELPVVTDGEPFPEHAFIDFTGLAKSAVEKKAKFLRNAAMIRNWLFRKEA